MKKLMNEQSKGLKNKQKHNAMLIEEIKVPAEADCAAAYKVAGTIVEMTMDGEYRVWSISPEPKLLLERGDYFAEAIAVAFSGTCMGGEKMEEPVINQNNSSKNKQCAE